MDLKSFFIHDCNKWQKNMEVIFYEVFSEEERALKAYLPSKIRADFRPGTIQSYLGKRMSGPVISTRTQSVIPKQWHGNLKGVLTRSSGYDHLRRFIVETQGKVPCGYLPDYCSRSVAEHALLVTLALLKKLKKQMNHFGTFNRNDLTGRECLGRNTLVVGVGKIGSEIVKLAQGVGMHVKGVDIIQTVPQLEYVTLEEGLSFADILICALPLTEETFHMLNYNKLRRLKKGSLFINISRGEISPFSDLSKLLAEEVLGGIALDVFEEEGKLASILQKGEKIFSEMPREIMALKDHDNVIFTPHNAFNTQEGLERKSMQSCLALKMFYDTGHFPEPVPEDLRVKDFKGEI